jgi:hypothetical protein
VIDPVGRARAWLERGGKRITEELPLEAKANERLGPISFEPRFATPVDLSWDGAMLGDELTAVCLDSLTDERLLSMELKSTTGSTTIELESACRVGLCLQRGATLYRCIQAWDPQTSRALHVEWPSTSSVTVTLADEHIAGGYSGALVLASLERDQQSTIVLRLQDGAAHGLSIAPGRYFFRLERSPEDTLLAGIAEHVEGTTDLVLVWRAMEAHVPTGDILIESIAGTELSVVPIWLRTISRSPELGVGASRPLVLRLPYDSKWSQVRQSGNTKDDQE